MDDFPKQKGRLRTASLLRPKYTCLTCSEVCAPANRQAHTKETGHQFYMESRGRTLFCQGCGDLVYDHDLERLRSLPYGMHQGSRPVFVGFIRSAKVQQHLGDGDQAKVHQMNSLSETTPTSALVQSKASEVCTISDKHVISTSSCRLYCMIPS
jgi:hypothetical protein